MTPRKRLLAALVFALPAAALVVTPAMAKTAKPKSQHAQTHKPTTHKTATKAKKPTHATG